MTQFVFYPKPHKLRCRGCKTELRYPTATGTKAAYFLLGALGGLITTLTALIVLLPFAEPAVLWPGVIALFVLQFVIAGYIEAAHVQKRYQPVPA
jgi:hypothetical protein